MDMLEIPIDEVVLDPGLNLRDRLDEETIERYAESWEDLPPVTVFDVDGHWLLADGFHRHAAFVTRNRPKIPAMVRQGTYAEALEHASGANLHHGLPLRRQERRRAVEVRLRINPERSDRQFSRELGVSRDLVARVRNDLVAAGQIEAVEGRIGADGKVYSTGLPRDPNEHLPGRADMPPEPRARPDDEGDRPPSRRSPDEPPSTPAPAESPANGAPPPSLADVRDLARSGPVEVSTPTIDEMLELMARQVTEVACWIEGEDFASAFAVASEHSKKRFQAAVRLLAEAAGQLDPS